MKSFFNYLLAFLFISVFYACGDDHDHSCEECHLAVDIVNPDGSTSEIMWEMTNPATGDHDWCDSDLATVESSGYMYTITSPLQSCCTDSTLPAGDYGPSNGYEIHCGEGDGDH